MCNLVDAFMEEQYQDPEFLAWLEQKNKQMRDQMEDYFRSVKEMEDYYNSNEYEQETINILEAYNQKQMDLEEVREYAIDAIAAEMNNQLMGYTDCDDSISSYIKSKELITELFKDAIANEEREYKSISEWEI